MTVEHRRSLEQLLGPAVLTHAANFGWIHRARIYFGLPVHDSPKLPLIEFYAAGELAEDLAAIRWVGAPTPLQLHPSDDHSPVFLDEHGRQGCHALGTRWNPTYATGRFASLTRESPTPRGSPTFLRSTQR